MDFRGLQRLISLLGGKIGAEYRRLAETTLTRLIAGDHTLAVKVEQNTASDAPIHSMAREALLHDPESLKSTAGAGKRVRDEPVRDEPELEHGELLRRAKMTRDEPVRYKPELEHGKLLRRAKMTRVEYDNAVVAAQMLAQCQRRITEDQCRAEQAKQATHAADLKTADGKAKIELDLIQKRAALLAQAREAELAFIERKKRLGGRAPEPPVPVPLREPVLKTIREIAQGGDYWQGLSTHMREELVLRAGREARKEQITPAPEKVREQNSHGIPFETPTTSSSTRPSGAS